MNKEEIYDILQCITKEQLINSLLDYFSVSELEGYMEHLEEGV